MISMLSPTSADLCTKPGDLAISPLGSFEGVSDFTDLMINVVEPKVLGGIESPSEVTSDEPECDEMSIGLTLPMTLVMFPITASYGAEGPRTTLDTSQSIELLGPPQPFVAETLKLLTPNPTTLGSDNERNASPKQLFEPVVETTSADEPSLIFSNPELEAAGVEKHEATTLLPDESIGIEADPSILIEFERTGKESTARFEDTLKPGSDFNYTKRSPWAKHQDASERPSDFIEATTEKKLAATSGELILLDKPVDPLPQRGIDDLLRRKKSPDLIETILARFESKRDGTIALHKSETSMPLGARVIDQVRDHFLDFTTRVETVEGKNLLKMRLNPAELGSVEIEIERDSAGKVCAQIRTESESAKHILVEGLNELRDSLKNAGIEVGRIDVSTGNSSSGEADGRPNDERHSGGIEFHDDGFVYVDTAYQSGVEDDRLVSMRA